jgi:hypothetical protein
LKEVITDKYIEELFEKHDLDKNGTLEKEEVKELVISILSDQDPASVDQITDEDHDMIYSLIDRNHDGSVSLDELKESLREWLPASGNQTALVVVDLQNDFISGTLAVTGAEEAVHATNKLRTAFPFDLVAHTRDWHPAEHCSFAATWGAKLFDQHLIPAVGGAPGATIEQVHYSIVRACGEPPLIIF